MGPAIRNLHSRKRARRPRRIRIFPRSTSTLSHNHKKPHKTSISHAKSQVNRNKKSLGLSFQHPSGVKILHELAKTCDVLVENYLPGSLKKYQMDYESLSKINPGLIYASITGYGQTGPYSNRAGYDVMVEAYVNCIPRSFFLSDAERLTLHSLLPVNSGSCT